MTIPTRTQRGDFAQNAPALRQSFDTANAISKAEYLAQRAQESAAQSQERHSERIATRAELDQRLAQRAVPAPAHELTMPGPDGVSAKRNAQIINEREIYVIRRRLEVQRGEPTRQFERNR